ncbi:hypothetical protein MASSI9I_50442 [Massilia sp. 9I]|nr:hypothetical protein MASSI9I_50442 [Massilia sp. 9I]
MTTGVAFLRQYLPPDLNIERESSYGRAEILESRFDTGAHVDEQVANDMIAMLIGADIKSVA